MLTGMDTGASEEGRSARKRRSIMEAATTLFLSNGHHGTSMKDLGEFGQRYIATVLQPEVLQLRRLVLAEASRFPEPAHSYDERTVERTLEILARHFRELGEPGLLRVADPASAAGHFAFLILGMPLDRATFGADTEQLTQDELNRLADDGVRVFLAAYGVPATWA